MFDRGKCLTFGIGGMVCLVRHGVGLTCGTGGRVTHRTYMFDLRDRKQGLTCKVGVRFDLWDRGRFDLLAIHV